MTDFKMDDYVPVAERVEAFYAKHPEGSIQSDIVELTPDRVTVKAYAYRSADDLRPGIGHSSLNIPGSTPFTRGSEIENAETSAWGRAIAALGFEVKRGLSSREEVRNKQEQGGERAPAAGRRTAHKPATTRPAAQRTAEEQQLLDELMAVPGITVARLSLLADAVGVHVGEHATADQLREMIARMTTPGAGVPASPGEGEAGRSVPASPTDTVQSEGKPVAGTAGTDGPTDSAAASPPSPGPAQPTLEDVLAVTGGELLPPRAGTDAYKALGATERAAARAYWQKQEVKP